VDQRASILVSVKGIPHQPWRTLPTNEAFALIYAMQQRMLVATLLLTVLAGGADGAPGG
jgi:hypothetical protein